MKWALAAGALVLLAGAGANAQDHPGAISQLREVGPAIYRCWRPPAGPAGEEITVVMSFKRDGAVLGKPRISHSTLTGSDGDQKAFVGSVLSAIAACTPLNISDTLGASMAGRPFAMRFVRAVKRVGV